MFYFPSFPEVCRSKFFYRHVEGFRDSAKIELDHFKMISLSELEPSNTAIIREVYDSDNAQELFEMELERALQVTFFLVVNS